MTGGVLNIYWDGVRGSTPEHYWQFLLGYFLPLMGFLLDRKAGDPASLRLYDSGPLMNRIAVEGLSRLHLSPDFDKSLFVKSDLKECLQRIEARVAADRGPARHVDGGVSSGTSVALDRWDMWVARGTPNDVIKSFLLQTRDAVAAILAPWACCPRNLAGGKYLIVQRSATPSYYEAGGGAIKGNYGAGRRLLRGIPEAQAQLQALGIRSLVYEPGIHNLACQINHFSVCAGMIAVRGSELANTLWTPPTAKIIMFMSSDLEKPPFAVRGLVRLLGRELYEIPDQGEKDPWLDVSRIRQYL